MGTREAVRAPHPQQNPSREYELLQHQWANLLPGLPEIDGWTITQGLPDVNAFQLPTEAEFVEVTKPAKDLAKYRFRLDQSRRRAARPRLEELVASIEGALPRLIHNVPRNSSQHISGTDADTVAASVDEIEILMGNTAKRRGRWSNLHRHILFGQGQDWHDINEFDWPSVRPDIEASMYTQQDPLPVPDVDLGRAAAGTVTGTATIAFPWHQIDDDSFERLLFDLFNGFPDHDNVQWLTRTNAPDRGRDLSLERRLSDSTGGVRTERVIVQAKHWSTRSVGPDAVSQTVTSVSLWQPPVVHVLIIATSGRFTSDAVAWVEWHNEKGQAPRIEMWPDNRLETLLTQRPALAAAYGLR